MIAAYPILEPALEKISARIAVSEDARRTLVEHMGGDAVLIPNGVFVDRFAAAEPRAGWRGAGGTLGFLGRIDEPRKGLPTSAGRVAGWSPARPGVRLLVAGPRRRRGGRRGRARRGARRGDVPRHGQRARTRRGCCARVDVYVAPNLGGESFGIVLRRGDGGRRAGARRRPRRVPPGARRRPGGRRCSRPATPPRWPRALLRAARRRPPAGRAVGAAAAMGRAATTGRRWPTSVSRVYETVAGGRRVGVERGLGAAAGRDRGLRPMMTLVVVVGRCWSWCWRGTSRSARPGWTGCTSGSRGPAARWTPSWSGGRRCRCSSPSSGLLDPATALLLADAAHEARERRAGATASRPRAT